MALLYSKSELEAIAQRLQCCAADAANEALAGEVFMDHSKKACGWNKFKFLKKTSKILSEYVPGGVYTETGNLEIENTIDPDLGETFQFKGATVVSDITSPYYGFAFAIYGEPDTGETYLYVIYNGELHSVFSTADYSAPYMYYVQSIAYDHANEVLLLGASSNIQEYDLAPLLNTIPEAPTASDNTSFPGTDNFHAAYNRINQSVYFTNSFPLQVKRFFTYGNFGIDIPLGGFSTPSSIEVNSSNGEIWVVCGTEIQVISPTANIVVATIDLASALGANTVNKITYDPVSDYFLVPWFDGLGANYVALIKGSDYSVYMPNMQTPSSNPTSIYQALYYQQLGEYVISDDYNTLVFPANYGFFIELPRTLLNDTKNNKLLVFTENCVVNPLDPFSPLCSSTPFRINVLSAPEEEVTLCLNDDDVQTMIETAQHYCCDCCPAPIIQLDYSSFSENPATEASEGTVPPTLYKIYYGKSVESGLAKLDPLELLSLTSINRYQYQGIYNYYTSVASYLYYAVPLNMGVPTGFFDFSTGLSIPMDAPYNVIYDGVLYKMYKSVNQYTTNISIQVI